VLSGRGEREGVPSFYTIRKKKVKCPPGEGKCKKTGSLFSKKRKKPPGDKELSGLSKGVKGKEEGRVGTGEGSSSGVRRKRFCFLERGTARGG